MSIVSIKTRSNLSIVSFAKDKVQILCHRIATLILKAPGRRHSNTLREKNSQLYSAPRRGLKLGGIKKLK